MRVVGALLTCRFEGRTCDLIRGTSPPILVPGLGVQNHGFSRLHGHSSGVVEKKCKEVGGEVCFVSRL